MLQATGLLFALKKVTSTCVSKVSLQPAGPSFSSSSQISFEEACQTGSSVTLDALIASIGASRSWNAKAVS